MSGKECWEAGDLLQGQHCPPPGNFIYYGAASRHNSIIYCEALVVRGPAGTLSHVMPHRAQDFLLPQIMLRRVSAADVLDGFR